MNRLEVTAGKPGLIRQIAELEEQIIRRRHSLHLQVTDARRKISGQLITPGVLLAAVGIGVGLERSHHLQSWSMATLFNAINTSLGLLQTLNPSDTTLR